MVFCYSSTNSLYYAMLSRFSRVRLCATPQTAATRLPLPWDSPGKSTGVGCHCLLQCMKVKSESEVAQSCPALSDPMDCSLTGSSVHGIFQARVLEWGAITFSDKQTKIIKLFNNSKYIHRSCFSCFLSTVERHLLMGQRTKQTFLQRRHTDG